MDKELQSKFEAWMISEGCHSSDLARVRDGYSNITMQMRYEAYRAAYAQARREALEECESICSRLWLRVDGTAHDCAQAVKDLIKD